MLLRHRDLDLPVFPAETEVLHYKEEYRKAVNEGQASFVRSLSVDSLWGWSLARTLRTAQSIFERLAEIEGLDVVPHQFGLAEITSHRTGNRDGVPDDYNLVAEVEVIHPVEPRPELISREYTSRLNRSMRSVGGWLPRPRLYDLDIGQYVYGSPDSQTDKTLHWLVDIEPRIALLTSAEKYPFMG